MEDKKYPTAHGIALKKQYGQHFLREQTFIDQMIDSVDFTSLPSVFEIGCGDGFLTRHLLQQPLARLWVFEIDPAWAAYVKINYPDERMTIFEENILEADFSKFESYAPWTLLANIPYQITFPLLHLLKEQRDLLKEGVIMVQEEAAQKLVKTQGRGYGFSSLFFQHFFELKLLAKIHPSAFYPPPKIFSRLLYFKPRQILDEIPYEQDFWRFVKHLFNQPRRILKNVLQSFHYDLTRVPEELLALRAQQMNKQEVIALWILVRGESSAEESSQ
ncbi:ribosomal RNA small subunit methyltransferase A [Candidatus Dependentiae bacterium]|nr:ribosomal RNA small subunit methyltransferase A [Candidatus Dependentiae bacterium]